ncbi:MAG: replication initiation factor domain-containing protein [Planctomycetes bacterium]|nr:replication initiation factor domain-containing protein [Planctomycetota bacterium]
MLFDSLEEGKTEAAGTKGILWGGGPWVIRASGRAPMYRFHLQRAELNLFVGKSQTGEKQANVYASLSADILWHKGVEGAVGFLRSCIEELGGQILEVKPSRVDLCADFLIPSGLALEFLRQFRVPAHTKIRLEEQGENLETVYIGARNSPIQLRIYDKSTELVVKGNKDWFWPIWGIDPCADVWRVEFQLRRAVLREFRIETVQGLTTGLGGLWEYLTEKWVSFRLLDDVNTTRRTAHPWWEAVQEQKTGFGELVQVERCKVGGDCSPHWYVSHIAGCLVGFAACIGMGDIGKASMELWRAIKDHWDRRDFWEAFAVRSVQLGRAPGERGARDESGEN